MASLLRWVRTSLRKKPSPPLRFPSTGFQTVPATHILEEERFNAFKQGHYYPVNIGDIFNSTYQVIGKLGYGTTSTVWLAHDLRSQTYVTLKIYTRDESHTEEFQIYKHLTSSKPSHPGYPYVRTALDTFTIPRSGGNHGVLVQKPMWESFRHLQYRNPSHRFSEDLLRMGLVQVLMALDYLHTECRLVHTDISSDNILQEIEDNEILEALTRDELETPSPRKLVDGVPVYASRRFGLPRTFGRVVLSDFGSAVRGDERRNHGAQPYVYRSPEVMLKTDSSYPVDIWNVGVMIWDLFEGKHMFYRNDPDGKGYSTRAHLAEVIVMLGPPPVDLLRRGKRSWEFFTEDGMWVYDVEIPQDYTLEMSEEFLEGRNKDMFLAFMRGMLQWRPEDRKTAKELLQDPWLNQGMD
ncbi:kinase domain protein [Aspergillus sclerotioniger CBS 115572]|uniref:non-specific serine/threonine protein kinase n=1 Tax=Aspergillus sclerotioniger CBS 115572 TaxID=1450535 RepID=A0A317XBC5_9EURO|nr:kinase domain protein [Aspergillus sclerotioniger CBS 115572]PWY95934.1 kinase domain protein [Aspergillus sclerotioniger CBS 115572]